MDLGNFDRRKFLQWSLLASGYSLATSSLLMAPIVNALGKLPRELKSNESVFTLSGKVKVDGKTATESTIITPNSKIETANDSQLIFVVNKDAHIVRENSEIILSTDGSNLEENLHLVKGKMLSVFGKRTSEEKNLNIQTTTATIGIRGTGVYSESHKDHSYVCTCYGQAQLASLKDPTSSELVTTTHHDSPRYILADGKAGSLIENAPVKNHTDEELMLIEALVGRAPPFSSLMNYSAPRRGY
jgi:hypothetical protein